MTNEVNQLTFFPFEESPLRGDSTDHGEDLEMAICTPLEKKLNVMTQDDLDRLRETYSFSIGIQARISKEGGTILSTHLGKIAFYEAAFPVGLRLPIHLTIRRILNFYNICPT